MSKLVVLISSFHSKCLRTILILIDVEHFHLWFDRWPPKTLLKPRTNLTEKCHCFVTLTEFQICYFVYCPLTCDHYFCSCIQLPNQTNQCSNVRCTSFLFHHRNLEYCQFDRNFIDFICFIFYSGVNCGQTGIKCVEILQIHAIGDRKYIFCWLFLSYCIGSDKAITNI